MQKCSRELDRAKNTGTIVNNMQCFVIYLPGEGEPDTLALKNV